MSNVKGITFDNQVFTPKTDGVLRERMFEDGVITGCGVSFNGASISIAAGFFILAGRLCQLPSAVTIATESTYENGYGRVKATLDLTQAATESTFEQANLSVEYSSTDSFPALTKGSINAGSDTLYEAEFAVVQFSSYDVSAVVRTIPSTDIKSPANYIHTKTGTVHALVGQGTSIKFNTTAKFNDGDTFTVNGAAVDAQLINGEDLPGDFFVSGVVASCFLHDNKLTFGGGGAMGSWKFTAATVLPATVSKNTFVAIASGTPATISTGETAPASPSAGDVWFNVVDPSGGDVFSDGSVPFRCLGAYEYDAVGSEWESITAYYSYLTEWKEVAGLPPAGGDLEDYTWEEINRIGELGRHEEYFSIGETKSVTLTTGEVITLILVGFNCDPLVSNPSAYAPYTFHMQDCLNTTQQMEATNTNVNGWSACKMRTVTLPAIKLTIPPELRDIIKTVQKKASAGNQSANIVTSNDDLWLASEVEIFGSIPYSKSGEGAQYPYYSTTSSRIKKVNNAAAPWWERSPYGSSAAGFCGVGTDGSAGYASASYSDGVAFGLCV